jgi:hypothetical protein
LLVTLHGFAYEYPREGRRNPLFVLTTVAQKCFGVNLQGADRVSYFWLSRTAETMLRTSVHHVLMVHREVILMFSFNVFIQEMFADLGDLLCEITGFDSMSLQPNAGASGEYAGLMVIRAYHDVR